MNFELPNSLQGTYSCKGATLITLAFIEQTIRKEHNADLQPLLLTPYGFIRCDIDLEDSSENLFNATAQENQYTFNLGCIASYRNSFINDIEAETPDIKAKDNGTLLNLKNVTIYSNGLTQSMAYPSSKFPEFAIFVDQILGFSLVPRIAE